MHCLCCKQLSLTPAACTSILECSWKWISMLVRKCSWPEEDVFSDRNVSKERTSILSYCSVFYSTCFKSRAHCGMTKIVVKTSPLCLDIILKVDHSVFFLATEVVYFWFCARAVGWIMCMIREPFLVYFRFFKFNNIRGSQLSHAFQ